MVVRRGDEALFRYQIVCLVLARRACGQGSAAAVRAVCAQTHHDHRHRHRRISERTLYRWMRAYERGGFDALAPASRPALEGSRVLPASLLDFVATERGLDRDASTPELIERAREQQIIGPEQHIDRTTLWRAMRRMGLETSRRRRPGDIDQRRYEHAARMLCVLGDFKHFWVTPKVLKRVAVYLLDDHSRFGLDVLCTTPGERSETMLEIVYQIVRRYGTMVMLYLDRGPAFIADDLALVCARLGIVLVHGKAAYPEGHAKIERFNQSLDLRVLRSLRRPDVDPHPGSLTLRLRHDLREVYNQRRHRSLGESPYSRFHAESQPALRPVDEETLREAFVVEIERTVSADHIVSVEGVDYEVPRGLRLQRIAVSRHLLERDDQDRVVLSVMHQGERVRIHPVDKHFNAHSGRARESLRSEAPSTTPRKSASHLSFERALAPMVGPDGGYSDPPESDDES